MMQITTQAPAAKAKLSDAALVLMCGAANREDGMVLPAPASLRVRGGALEKTLTKLLREGLVTEVSVRAAEQAWRSDEEARRIGLKITEAGLQAIGVAPPQERLGADEQSSDEPPASLRRKGKAAKKAAQASVPTDAAAAGSGEAEPDPAAPPAAKRGSKQALLMAPRRVLHVDGEMPGAVAESHPPRRRSPRGAPEEHPRRAMRATVPVSHA